MAEEIGGFWAGLSLKPDEASFAAGERGLGKIVDGLKAIAAVLITQRLADELVKLAQAQAQMNVTASFAGMGTDALSEWAIMMKTANVDSQAFVASLSDLNNQFIRMNMGEALPEKTAKAVGLLGLDLGKIMNEDSSRRSAEIMTAAAAKVSDGSLTTAAAAQRVKDLLGQAGAEYFTWLEKSGKTLDSQMTLAHSLMFTNSADRRAVMDPMADLNSLRASFSEMASQFATKFMIHLDPAFKSVLSWIADPKNKKAISDTIDEWAARFGDLASSIGKLAPALGVVLTSLGSAMDLLSGKQNMNQGSLSIMMAAQNAGIKYSLADVDKAIGGFHPIASLWNDMKTLAVGNPRGEISVKIQLSPDAKRYLIVNSDTGDVIEDAGAVAGQR